MKITAEFDSYEEFINFANDLSTTHGSIPVNAAPIKEDKPAADNPKIENKKEDIPKVDAEVIGVSDQYSGTVDAETVKNEAPDITKEMVRAVFTKIIKAGKQAEAKALTAKYGASKIPEIKKEDYAAIYKEAEGLL